MSLSSFPIPERALDQIRSLKVISTIFPSISSSPSVIQLLFLFTMSSEMDRALLALFFKDDDDFPFNLPDLPQYYTPERNTCSLIGRFLNPEFQKMAKLILDMPRK